MAISNEAEYDFSGNTQYLFGRLWSVEIGTPGQPGQLYEGLRTEFDITKTSASGSNKAKIKLWNLNAESRKNFVKGKQLTLRAGYVGLIETLFLGNIVRVNIDQKGSDIAVEFECGDGEQQLYNNFINKSYPPGATNVQVIQDLVKALGLTVGTISGLVSKSFNSGFVASGGIKDILDRELRKIGCEWSVQNGVVQVLPVGSTTGESAILVSKETGLIGVPTPGNGGDGIVTFESLLNPRILPGVSVSLVSQQFNGIYKVRQGQYQGDSSSNDKWKVICECTQVLDRVVAPAQNKGALIKVSS